MPSIFGHLQLVGFFGDRLSPWRSPWSARSLSHSRNSCQRFNLRYELLPRSYQHNHKINVPHKIKKLALRARPPSASLFLPRFHATFQIPGPHRLAVETPTIYMKIKLTEEDKTTKRIIDVARSRMKTMKDRARFTLWRSVVVYLWRSGEENRTNW